MSKINYSDYNVDTILSTEKNIHKKNLVKINDKFYFQIPNEFEQTLESEDEASYKDNIQIQENGSYAKILNINDLYSICQYFQLEHEITAVLIFQFLKFELIQENFVNYFQNQKTCNVLQFIERYNRFLLQNMLRPLNRYRDAIQTYSQYLSNYKIFHKNIINACISPVNIQRMQELILQDKSNEITEEEKEKFVDWVELLDFQIINQSPIFDECHSLEEDDVWTFQRVQKLLDESINDFQVDENYIESMKIKGNYQDYFVYDKDHLNNMIFPKITKEKQEKRCTGEMRLKNRKYRLAIKSQSCEFLQTLFYKNKNEWKLNSKILDEVKNELKDQYIFQELESDYNAEEQYKINYKMEKLIKRKYYVYLDLKDFCLNIDYNVVEKLINMPQLANYLRQRKVYYVDPVTKQEEQLILKKGILIGEVYLNYVMACLSDLLLKIVKEIFAKKLNSPFYDIDYSSYVDDFFIQINLKKEVDQSEFVSLIEDTLKELEQKLNKLGFSIMNKNKLQLLGDYDGKINSWKINDQFQFRPCQSFVIFDQDLLDNCKIIEKEIEQKRIDEFFSRIDILKDNCYYKKAQIDKLSKMEQYFIVIILKMSNNVDPQLKVKTIEYIQQLHQLSNLLNLEEIYK
ncbi:hypothetical protein ABPG74_012436 [Tetrahymena malaccensis]